MIKKIALNPIPEITYRDCIESNEPLVITDIFSIFPNLAKWDIDFLAEKIVDKEALVQLESLEADSYGWQQIRIQTSEYFRKMKTGFSGEPLLYLAQQNISVTHPELEELIEFDQLLPYGIVKQSNLWIGPGGTKAPLHMDPDINFFLQLKGSKTFYLFSPADTQYIYANSPISQKPEFSQIQASNIDYVKYPKAKQAKVKIVKLEEGEILYLPAYWWHEVVNGLENSISINLWCHTKFFGNYQGMRQLIPKKIKHWVASKFSNFYKK